MKAGIATGIGVGLILITCAAAAAPRALAPRGEPAVTASDVQLRQSIRSSRELLAEVTRLAPPVKASDRTKVNNLIREASGNLRLAQELTDRYTDAKSRRMATRAADQAEQRLTSARRIAEGGR